MTRHLVALFPEAEMAVADLESRKVMEAVTHFDAALVARAVGVMIDAPAPGGF